MSYQISLGSWGSVFAVPSSVVDQHIKIASETQLKVLLYLLRHSDESLDDHQLSESLRISPEEVKNAVSFWIERGLLSEHEDTLLPATPVQASVVSAPTPSTEQPRPKKHRTTVSRAQRPDPLFVAKLLKEDRNLAGLLEEAQIALKKPLSSGDTGTLVMLYDSFGLPCEVIAMLLNYLAASGNADMRAVERYGIRWSDEGIKTVTDAEIALDRMARSKEAWGRVSSLLGIRNIGRPTKAQMENADRWLNTWQFSNEMITEAYERCVNTKGEYSMSYINAILKRWYAKGIKSLDTLQMEESASKKKPKTDRKGKSGKGSVYSVENASFNVQKYEDDSLFDD